METFSVTQFFVDGYHETVRKHVTAEEAMKAFQHYTNNVACTMGIIAKVIITDADDFCNLEWKPGEGITYPPQLRGQHLPPPSKE